MITLCNILLIYKWMLVQFLLFEYFCSRVAFWRTWSDCELSCAADRAVRVGRRAAEQTPVLRKGLRYHQGADLLLKKVTAVSTFV